MQFTWKPIKFKLRTITWQARVYKLKYFKLNHISLVFDWAKTYVSLYSTGNKDFTIFKVHTGLYLTWISYLIKEKQQQSTNKKKKYEKAFAYWNKEDVRPMHSAL